MGLDQTKESSESKQLSLFDYQMPTATFAPAKNSVASYDWETLYAANEPVVNKMPRFVSLSAIVHAAALLLVAIMAVPAMEDLKPETITIELEDLSSPGPLARGEDVAPTQGATAAIPEDLPTQTLTVEKAVAPATSKVVAASKSVAPKTNFNAVPATIEDIEAPELDAGAIDKTPVATTLPDEELNEDLAKADDSAKANAQEEKKALDDMASAIEEEQSQDLAAIAEANKKEQERLQELQENLKQKNAAAIAAAEDKEAKARAALAAEEAAAAALASSETGEGHGQKEGDGAGNNGANSANNKLAGVPTGVRSLDQLRQMPGNPRPQYDRIERRRGDQGEIAFVAYISKEGFPTKFKMLKSTGFRNLDGKTLAALKRWRFYPGQEGWVEIPFRWDLKGGVQQDGGTLRRSATNL